ncbi:MAG: molecular chaperone TorD family protein [Chloroflexi bacterium]|nr:molecular chaperone TorD family protein [Chloroflexota bacterium]
MTETSSNGLVAIASLAGGLARGFAYPDEAFCSSLRDGTFADLLFECARKAGLNGVGSELHAALQEARDRATPVFQGEHTLLFARNVPCPLNASAYEPQSGLSTTRSIGDVAGFYGAFGYQVASRARELPDHLCVELEFLGVLAAKEAYAAGMGRQGQAGVCRRARYKFAEEHLSPWLPELVKRLREKSRLRFYPAFGMAALELSRACAGPRTIAQGVPA